MRLYPFPLCFGLLIVPLAVFTLPGCGKKPAPQGGRSPAAPSGQVATEAEARQFAKSFVADVKAGNLAAINAAIDWDAILDRAFVGCEMPAEFRQQFIAGAKRGIFGPNGIGAAIVNQVKQGADYRLLHVHQQDGQQRVLFRLLLPGGGVNYHDLILVRRADGEVHAYDIFVFATGEMLSETTHRGILPFATEASKSLLDKLTQQEGDYVKNVDKVRLFISHAQAREGTGRWKSMTSFPTRSRRTRTFLSRDWQPPGRWGPNRRMLPSAPSVPPARTIRRSICS